ncbi:MULTISPECIES: hypothetical protein [Shewanella]|uniref:Uncharacterized protein n=1 Tax=Shewanella submarina TaxID=2016376 RepID=A0ABV7GKL0_9GAMM|nr:MULTISPECIES: hypothetical protein [Shewanella]
MKRKMMNNAAARRRTLQKARHQRMLHRQKQFFTFIQLRNS